MISYDFFVSEDLKPPTSHPRCSFNELSQQEPHVCTVAIELRVEDRIATPNFKASERAGIKDQEVSSAVKRCFLGKKRQHV